MGGHQKEPSRRRRTRIERRQSRWRKRESRHVSYDRKNRNHPEGRWTPKRAAKEGGEGQGQTGDIALPPRCEE